MVQLETTVSFKLGIRCLCALTVRGCGRASMRSQDRARRRAGPGLLVSLGAELGERLKWDGQKRKSLAPSPL